MLQMPPRRFHGTDAVRVIPERSGSEPSNGSA